MTGLEQLITKVSNATTAALMGDAVQVAGPWNLEELRQQALEDAEREFTKLQRQRRRMIRQSCE